MQSLRLLADDLTGALDTSAELVGAYGPLNIYWAVDTPPTGEASFVFDSGTRELYATDAAAIVQRLTPLLCGAEIAFKKMDSLLRGPWVAEIAACLQAGSWDACIVAPAFVYQGRRTRGGQQYAREPDGNWRAVGGNLVEELRQHDLEARLVDPKVNLAADLLPGVSIFDAETDHDLDRVVEIGRRYRGKVLWCGAGGLAAALARGTSASVSRTLKAPVLGIFGSDHPATEAQLEACGDIVIRATEGYLDVDHIKRQLDQGVALVRLTPPGTKSRTQAAQHFAQEVVRLSLSIDRPATLIIAGGETLKAQCLAVEARALRVFGRLEPGVAKSVIQGGSWAGIDVISKSGAFGPPSLWRNLLHENNLI
jgi:D-threonate/D-erythronate kinase